MKETLQAAYQRSRSAHQRASKATAEDCGALLDFYSATTPKSIVRKIAAARSLPPPPNSAGLRSGARRGN